MIAAAKCWKHSTAANPTPDLARRVAGRMVPYYAATPAASCIGSGVPFFAFSALVISRWLAPEVAVYATAHSPCALCGLRQEVAMSRLVPLHILSAPPIEAEAIVPTLYDPEEFAALYHADKDRAIALVSAMAAPQRVRQALAYAAWLAHYGLEIDIETVLAAWEAP
jgi:hypothetical protein